MYLGPARGVQENFKYPLRPQNGFLAPLTLSLKMILALFLCDTTMIPGSCSHASPSTCIGRVSGPWMVILA